MHAPARFLLLALFGLAAFHAKGDFGLTETPDLYTVDTGAGLVFSVRRVKPRSSLQSAGDLASLKYQGVEYQDQLRGSHVNSGLGSAAVTASQPGKDFVRIEVKDDAGLIHYYLARRGFPQIYMATYFATEPKIGLVRYIVRIPADKLPNGPAPSDIRHSVRTVEAHDVFGMSDGTTRSKHYSNQRLLDWKYIGATGPHVGLWMVRDNNEGGSGGPFYRSLLNQCGNDQEITYIVNYGEGQTEPLRTGILNSYTLVFTTGEAPPPLETGWLKSMGLTGYVPAEGRGKVTGAGISGRVPAAPYLVSLASPAAQYWSTARPADGAWQCAEVLPGAYSITLYKNELAVWTGKVEVKAGAVSLVPAITITDDPAARTPLWRIGTWDGSPAEFLNGKLATTMHPSDPRLSPWKTDSYIVGTSTPAANFPCYSWKEVNSPQLIKFHLKPEQVAAHTVRVGITTAQSGGRPHIAVNSWSGPLPGPSEQPRSRTMTVGTYRGRNTTFTFAVPASAFVEGENTLRIDVASGSGGAGFLSAGYSYDCLELTD